jgi:NAD(P)H-flavin reductase
MADKRLDIGELHRLEREDFPLLLERLRGDGYKLMGPTVRDGAIRIQRIESVQDLPVGWTDEQAPGTYRLQRREDDAYFGFRAGPQSWKRHLFPPRDPVIQLKRHGDTMEWRRPVVDDPPMAFIGILPCDLAAIKVQDRVWMGAPFHETRYVARRRQAFLVALNCLEPGELCFCESMGTGPKAGDGFDLCLTELDGRFLVEVGSDRGREVLATLPISAASYEDRDLLRKGLQAARNQMGRKLGTKGLAGILFGNIDHPQWEDVAKRCLTCGNCTHVCPTCFCFNVRETGTLADGQEDRERFWDSCFSLDHSMIHGGYFRSTPKQRYRQWLTHKLGAWESQFGVSGCVGCGRCIAWCPVGIDITEEAEAIRKESRGHVRMPVPREHGVRAGDALVPSPAQIIHTRRETPDTATLWLEPMGPFRWRPGQFNMLSIPGVGDVPISISGQDGSAILHTIRAVGKVTEALTSLESGALVGMRGPFGTSWPLKTARGRIVTVVAGGIGLAPLRGAVRVMAASAKSYPTVRLLYGARTPEDILYPDELELWGLPMHTEVGITVDRAGPDWPGNVGVVTNLLHQGGDVRPDGLYLVCGPEIMMRVVVESLLLADVPEEHIYLSLERNMKCGAGFCGRCQKGPFFICKDGPVFRYDKVSFIFKHPGL